MTTPTRIFRTSGLAFALAFSLSGASEAGSSAETPSASTHAGRAKVYSQLQENSLEEVTSSERLLAVTLGSSAPTEVWRALEHGERVECLECIPRIGKLLYAENSRTREISAWWLRRRIFGVFGPGQIYSQTLDVLDGDASETRRAYAAQAVGEFLVAAGVPHVARAAVSDASPLVRASAVRALERLNSEGPAGELGTALSDGDRDVRLAALRASTHINVFSHLESVVERLSDSDAEVRRRAAEVLGTMRAADAVVGLMALATEAREEDASVRAAAVGALGKIGDSGARSAVEAALADSDPLVQSVARIALFRL